MDPSGPVQTDTARGDRDQRRRDVLAAAAATLEERGWDDFSIREIAGRAGVSGGAVYQWFSGKGEIWARLQTARFRADTQAIAEWPDDLPDVEVVHRLIDVVAKNHADIGRHRLEFVKGLKGRVPDYAAELTDAHQRLRDAIAARVERLYGDDGPPRDLAARLSWLWAVGKGVGDHLIDDRFEAMGVGRAPFMDTTAACVLAGLRAPVPATVENPRLH